MRLFARTKNIAGEIRSCVLCVSEGGDAFIFTFTEEERTAVEKYRFPDVVTAKQFSLREFCVNEEDWSTIAEPESGCVPGGPAANGGDISTGLRFLDMGEVWPVFEAANANTLSTAFRIGDVVVVRRDVGGRRISGETMLVRAGEQGTVVQVFENGLVAVEVKKLLTSDSVRFRTDVTHLAPPPSHWKFRVEELSAGVYSVTASGPRGLQTSSTGTDLDRALADCREFALRCLLDDG